MLISRNYRGDIPMRAIDSFLPLLKAREDEDMPATPIVSMYNTVVFERRSQLSAYQTQ